MNAIFRDYPAGRLGAEIRRLLSVIVAPEVHKMREDKMAFIFYELDAATIPTALDQFQKSEIFVNGTAGSRAPTPRFTAKAAF